ncbi:unnamed protein product [Miscanthus lutarioriparius]|uniref:Retrotransposon gag domain-containing protein n=1 Tax=Miscanthus lutarioriparius TaxID=422564 RepID=A0A811PFN6_9POAL|nr:unnamed protein product [Miscanthus lutarioriparius]
MDMEANPLFGVDLSDAGSSLSSSVDNDPPTVTAPQAAILQTVNIKEHVPVELNLAESNYTEWCCFFDAFIGKFGIDSHLSSPPTVEAHRDPWAVAYSIWSSIHDQFHDNKLHRTVYLEAEFRSLVQGDMDITAYTGQLKQLPDALRDVGQPVRVTNQVLNMLCGLNAKYRHAVLVITTKNPPHSFLLARTYLLLEEQYDREHAKAA